VHLAYWILGGLLALFYLYSGGVKVVRSPVQLKPMMAWVDRFPPAVVKTVGTLEVLGAIGLVLPPLTGIAPALAFVAAVAFVVLQIGAIATHLTSTDDRRIAINIGVLVLTGVVVWLATIWL
jgi:DoxX-like family